MIHSPPLQLSPPLHYLQCSVPGGWDWREGDNPFAVFVNANDSPFALIIKPKLYPPFNEVWIYHLQQSYNASHLVGLPWLAHTVPHTIQPCCMYWTWGKIRESAPKELVLVVPGCSLPKDWPCVVPTRAHSLTRARAHTRTHNTGTKQYPPQLKDNRSKQLHIQKIKQTFV